MEAGLIKMGELIFPSNVVVLDTKTVPNAESHIPVILGLPFLATLINYKNGMIKLLFDIITLELNIFNPRRHPYDFDYRLNLNWIGEFFFMMN